ncbi:MAG: GntR family transcriptional regulator [Xanthomonadales bacterium]|nr:GntR family transcriptional regulator [Xanthomonadales bacterium]MDL1869487.1 GntR family transcriptional regulator [Gammaproteobacteria bacterium PRO6]
MPKSLPTTSPTTEPRPLAYLRLRADLVQAIDSGELGPGHALPGERELARRHGVSRVTVRKALAGLVADGRLVQRHGAGTFVSERIVKSFSHLTSFSDDLRARGLAPHTRTLAQERGEVTPEEAMALNLSPGARVLRLRRLRHGGDEPLAIERSVIPEFALPEGTELAASLYETLDRFGLRPRRALQRLRAVACDAEAARLLGVANGSACLLIERRGFLDDARVVEFTQSLYRGDAYDFVAELTSIDHDHDRA